MEEQTALGDEMSRLRHAEEDRRRRRRRWLRGPLGSWLALVGFALPFMTLAVERCNDNFESEVIAITDSISGYELVTGGAVQVDFHRADDVAGLIDATPGSGRGDIDPQPLAIAALAAAVAGAVLGLRRKKPTNSDRPATITITGVVALFGIAALLALRGR